MDTPVPGATSTSFERRFDDIDRSLVSREGSRSDAWVMRNESTSFNDGRSMTETTFYDDADERGPPQAHRERSERRSWTYLAKLNDGLYTGSRKQQNYDADVTRWIDAMTSFLHLPPNHTDDVRYVMQTIDLGEIQNYTFSAEKIILTVISLVVDTSIDEDDLESWTTDDWIVFDDDFERLMDDVELTRDELWRARRLVTRISPYFG